MQDHGRIGVATRMALPWALALFAAPALAATVSLNGSGTLAPTYQFLNPTGSGNELTTASDYALAVPGQYIIGDQFSSQLGSSPLTGTTGGVYTFQDTYQFTIGAGASGDVLTASLSYNGGGPAPLFDISNMQFRLYEVAAGTAPTTGGLPAGATLVTSWMGVASNTATVATFLNIQPGEYFLDVVGTADGTSGGTYTGQINLAPVPLPATLPLLASGLGLLGGLVRRRR